MPNKLTASTVDKSDRGEEIETLPLLYTAMSETTANHYTWDDYQAWPDDQRFELINGEVFAMSPSPGVRHQTLQLKLAACLDAHFAGNPCQPFIAPLDLKLSHDTVVQPDLMVVCRPEQIRPTHIEGAPALVIEILSASTRVHDRHVKMGIYARHGVPEVWLVTTEPGLIEIFQLDGLTYRFAASFTANEPLTTTTFPDLRIDLAALFQGSSVPFPPLRCVKETAE